MIRDIDLSLLRAFVAVAETGNMTVAGRHLNLTQAAVSQQIKRLEDQFGKVLFDRRQRGLRLTPTGERLTVYAERIITQNNEIWGLMTSHGFEGRVRLGVPHDIVVAFMPHILRGFAKSWPRVEVILVSSISADLRQFVEEGEVDLTLTTESTSNGQGELLLADRLVWAGAQNGSAHEREPLPVSLGDDHCAFRASASKALAAVGRDWRPYPADNMSALAATVEADLTVALLLSQTVAPPLRILNGESGLPTLPTFYVNLYRATTNLSPVSLGLARHISQCFAARYPKAA